MGWGNEYEQPRLHWLWWVGVELIIGLTLILVLDKSAGARDLGQWEDSDPIQKLWFQSLMQPDTVGLSGPGVSCCGEADAYWADEARVRDGKLYAIITDTRPDEPLKRTHEEVGAEYEIPKSKIVGFEQQRGNPTGHVVLFLGTVTWPGGMYHRDVLCYIPNGGV